MHAMDVSSLDTETGVGNIRQCVLAVWFNQNTSQLKYSRSISALVMKISKAALVYVPYFGC